MNGQKVNFKILEEGDTITIGLSMILLKYCMQELNVETVTCII